MKTGKLPKEEHKKTGPTPEEVIGLLITLMIAAEHALKILAEVQTLLQ